jgi:hypothetical protein
MAVATNVFKRRGTTAWLNKVEYTGFPVGSIPNKFGFIYDAENDKDGITSWFNHKGWTFVRKSDL